MEIGFRASKRREHSSSTATSKPSDWWHDLLLLTCGGKTRIDRQGVLPVRHYAEGDREAAAGLREYTRPTSRADFSDKYTEAIEEIM